VEEGRFRTVARAIEKHFSECPGRASRWELEFIHLDQSTTATIGHEVLVVNVTELHGIVRNISKSDQVNDEKLAPYWRGRSQDPPTHDCQIVELARTRDPETKLLETENGIGKDSAAALGQKYGRPRRYVQDTISNVYCDMRFSSIASR